MLLGCWKDTEGCLKEVGRIMGLCCNYVGGWWDDVGRCWEEIRRVLGGQWEDVWIMSRRCQQDFERMLGGCYNMLGDLGL